MSDIATMPAGLELDQLIAERIFEEPRPNRISPTSVVRSCILRGDPIVSPGGGWQQVLGNGRPVWEPRPFSTEWGLMGLVAEKMGYFRLFRWGSNWQCEGAFADAETAPLAVCRAALMAVANE